MRHRMSAAYFACAEDTRFAIDGEADCVMVDDVDRLGAEAQIGLFNLYNRIRDEGHALPAGNRTCCASTVEVEG